jgi:hypothetical protein
LRATITRRNAQLRKSRRQLKQVIKKSLDVRQTDLDQNRKQGLADTGDFLAIEIAKFRSVFEEEYSGDADLETSEMVKIMEEEEERGEKKFDKTIRKYFQKQGFDTHETQRQLDSRTTQFKTALLLYNERNAVFHTSFLKSSKEEQLTHINTLLHRLPLYYAFDLGERGALEMMIKAYRRNNFTFVKGTWTTNPDLQPVTATIRERKRRQKEQIQINQQHEVRAAIKTTLHKPSRNVERRRSAPPT